MRRNDAGGGFSSVVIIDVVVVLLCLTSVIQTLMEFSAQFKMTPNIPTVRQVPGATLHHATGSVEVDPQKEPHVGPLEVGAHDAVIEDVQQLR